MVWDVQSPVKECDGEVQGAEVHVFEGDVVLHAYAGRATVVRRPRAATSSPVRKYLLS